MMFGLVIPTGVSGLLLGVKADRFIRIGRTLLSDLFARRVSEDPPKEAF